MIRLRSQAVMILVNAWTLLPVDEKTRTRGAEFCSLCSFQLALSPLLQSGLEKDIEMGLRSTWGRGNLATSPADEPAQASSGQRGLPVPPKAQKVRSLGCRISILCHFYVHTFGGKGMKIKSSCKPQ